MRLLLYSSNPWLGLLTIGSVLLSLAAETPNNRSFTINPKPLVLRTTREGIGAVFFRIVYAVTQLKNKRNLTIITLPSPHYNYEQLSICKYFDFSHSIQCADSSDVDVCRPFNTTSMLLTEDCIEGYTPSSGPSMGIKFSDFSHSLVTLAMRVLKIDIRSTYVFHWRRGDALANYVMCTGQEVKPLNCLGVAELIKDVQKKANNRTVYIATNEQNATILHELASLGFHTSYSLVGLLEQAGIELSLSNLIVVDLLLMCKAEAFHHYGKSSLDRLANQCRESG